MVLWIRSQDDHLISLKDNDIYIETRYVNKPRIETEIGHEYFKEKVYVIENNFHYLGTYKSKEIALEVLDEIQDILKPKLHHISDKDLEGNDVKVLGIEHINSIVYEMPID